MVAMRRMVLVVVVAACGGEDPADPASLPPSLAFVSPGPGQAFTRDSLDDIGALVAAVPVEVVIEGAPARVALSIGGRELATLDAAGLATATVGLAGPATLTATAFDAAGGVVATADVAVTIGDPDIADCHAWLDLYGIAYTVGPDRPGVDDPVTAMMPINGIPYAYAGTPRTTMFGDCTLFRSLAEAAPSLRARNIVEVTDLGVYNYRCIGSVGTPPDCPNGISQHAFGNAIDLAVFEDADGETYNVTTDWVIDPADDTCTAATTGAKDQLLHELICELKSRNVWNIVLTPNYNAAHRDHFHVDLTAGSDFIERTAAGAGVRGPRSTDAHDH